MNILIFGGSGIISSEITNLAIDKGNSVTIVNRGRRKNLINVKANLIIADLKKDNIANIIDKLENHYDVVIDVISYNKETLTRNFSIVGKLCTQYCLLSSAVVYKTKIGRYSEADELGNNEWSYSINKIKCEETLKELSEKNRVFWTIIRPYITYGKTRIPLQFGPLEYFTVINRAIANKVIPIYDKEVNCTLTYSKDFAVGIVGLLGNEKAYNECFNITGKYETTWSKVLETTFKEFGIKYDTIGIGMKLLRNNTLMRGINNEEVIGDKSRDMLFDNSKITRVVPEFIGTTSYSKVVKEIVEYYNTIENQVINYAWDARVDFFLSQLDCLTKEQKHNLKYAPGSNATFRDKVTYYMNRYTLTYTIYRAFKGFTKNIK